MSTQAREATVADLPRLVELMTEFYAESDYALDPARAESAFAGLLADPRLGRVWVLESDGEAGGYVVLTFGYSMEYGGRDAFLDDLYVRPDRRGRGLGKLALETALAACHELGVRAVHLEAERGGTPAQALYRAAGFTDTDRQLLTLKLASPLHDT